MPLDPVTPIMTSIYRTLDKDNTPLTMDSVSTRWMDAAKEILKGNDSTYVDKLPYCIEKPDGIGQRPEVTEELLDRALTLFQEGKTRESIAWLHYHNYEWWSL